MKVLAIPCLVLVVGLLGYWIHLDAQDEYQEKIDQMNLGVEQPK